MLIRFEVSNFRSIRDPVELSLVAVDADRPEARERPMLGASLLPVAAIYGPNASGKSNLIAAFAWLCSAVRESFRAWDEDIPVVPFAFGQALDSPSGFVVESTVAGIRFEYVLELTRAAVTYEALFHYPEKKRRRIFERENGQLKVQRGLGGFGGTRELLVNQALILSIARRFGEPLVIDFVRDLLDVQVLGLPNSGELAWAYGRRPNPIRSTRRIFQQGGDPTLFDDQEFSFRGVDERDRALALLRLADLGIEDVAFEKLPGINGGPARERLQMVHRFDAERHLLDIVQESAGTRSWFELIGPVLAALRDGSLLLFDELDASLHPALSAQLIGLFHDPSTNPRGAQLIFSSHDTSLLNHLNRDEVWLTEKGRDGVTRLGALAEFAGERVRKSQNLERGYLHGRFGALPDVDQTDLLRALGLIG